MYAIIAESNNDPWAYHEETRKTFQNAFKLATQLVNEQHYAYAKIKDMDEDETVATIYPND